ncbi:hypothetical protein HET69_28525 [Streptomyces sp. CJ_13]|uniref:hypothetical protein n=1 Tax=Streptomyces sp. CJ_13 TaxID=2724943 RepID=UPI001BDD7CC9|nr:hypothetical protein [Streptomyces sp. CJ_13]MBT1187825.1 hypothetical protein [Streptomyces sp. CJ_13]
MKGVKPMVWPEIAGAGVPLLLLLLYAGRRLMASVELVVAAHQERLGEREQRKSLVEVAEALPDGGLVVQYEGGRPDWVLLKPSPGGSVPLPSMLERSAG